MATFRLLRAGLAFAVVTLSSGLALAQQTPPTPPPLAAPAAEPAASHLAAARDLINSSGAGRSFDAVLPALTEQIRQTFSRTRPELVKDLDDVISKLTPEIEAQREDIIKTAAKVYASKMTEQELRDASAFFSSPVGQKYVTTQPIIFDELFNEMQNWMGRVSDFTLNRVRAEMKKRGHDL